MSDYQCQYWSDGKQERMIIESINDFHIVAAYRKLKKQLAEKSVAEPADGSPANDAKVLAALEHRIKKLGLDPAYKGGLGPGNELLNGREPEAFGD